MRVYRMIEKIGEGGFSKVYKAEDMQTGEQVAVKKWLGLDMREKMAKRELAIMTRIGHHRNVMGLRAVARDEHGCPMVVMELMQKGSLHDLLGKRVSDKGTGFEEHEVRFFAEQVLKGIEHIHSHGLLHRDLKPANILVNRSMEVKVADLGLARERPVYVNGCLKSTRASYTSNVGTRQYMAPEVLNGTNVYGGAADMWSFGCILGELFLGEMMFGGGKPDQWDNLTWLFTSSSEASIKATLQRKIPRASACAIDLMSKLLNLHSDERPTATEALRHPFFRDSLQQPQQQRRQHEEQEQLRLQQDLEQQPETQVQLRLQQDLEQQPETQEQLRLQQDLEQQPETQVQLRLQQDLEQQPETQVQLRLQQDLEQQPETQVQLRLQQEREQLRLQPETQEQLRLQQEREQLRLQQERLNQEQEQLRQEREHLRLQWVEQELVRLRLQQEQEHLDQERLKLQQEQEHLEQERLNLQQEQEQLRLQQEQEQLRQQRLRLQYELEQEQLRLQEEQDELDAKHNVWGVCSVM